MSLAGKSIVLCVTGGIAAYKAAEVVSRLKKRGADVFVLMTRSACEFITPLTLEVLSCNRVVSDMFNRDYPWEVEHISLAKRADVFVVAPATANIIGKAAHGIADDMVSTTLLATKAPVIFAPAMNSGMYTNTVVNSNLNQLQKRGFCIVQPDSGRLACGDCGVGKLADPIRIVQAIERILTPQDLTSLSIAVTAGPTREALDPVRFLSNHSTGKMGYALAARAKARGADVTLISGPVSLAAPADVKLIHVTSALEMQSAVMGLLEKQDIIIKAAAVGDYRPAAQFNHKIKKNTDSQLSIELIKNPDILMEIGQKKRLNQTVCGFSMETRDLIENSRRKLESKNCDLIVANSLTTEGAGFAHDTNIVTLLFRDGSSKSLPLMSKESLSDVILDHLLQIYKKKTQ